MTTHRQQNLIRSLQDSDRHIKANVDLIRTLNGTGGDSVVRIRELQEHNSRRDMLIETLVMELSA